ncbi:alpha-amylase family glycosyl hydrolase [Hymenobacter sp.]|uniref:alpha-amylase family glycosyl hydrolase n=1 Tax=Hymenobacter sp. TaxID=1898978 RepID=UPI00286C6413|nr:alpha-amylase family glycosyl hydrolase [Hymenobacter sp.]
MNKLVVALLLAALFAGPARGQAARPALAPVKVTHPAWVLRGNVYEVNVRQYTPEGTLNAFARHLDRLKAMGVETLWFMPLSPISQVGRKGSLGSYYAVADYAKINPEFGTLADWNRLVAAIHARGMRVLIDWVPNHTGADHPWLARHPDFFVKDPAGQPAVAFDWADVRQLDYRNPVMQDSMIAAMRYWVTQTNIDGFRVDVAWNVPETFWRKCIPQLRQGKDLFMLAEGDSAYLPRSGFDAVYPWHMFHEMEKVARGQRPATVLDSIYQEQRRRYLPATLQLYFTSNHDENSWNKADFGTFPGAVHAPFAVFSQTMAGSLPLIYSGQEEPTLRALQFFDKDPIGFGQYQRAAFYQTLLDLRQRSPALAADAGFRKVRVGDERAVYAYVREKAGHKVLVLLNLSAQAQTVAVPDKTLLGSPRNVFTGQAEKITSQPRLLAPWAYAVYEYAK